MGAKGMAEDEGRCLAVVVSVCGTDGDPQGLAKQEETLREAGAAVFPSNARVSAFARDIVLQRIRRD